MANNSSLFDVHKLSHNIVITLPCSEEAQTALRHIHTIDMEGYHIVVVIPARLFDSTSFAPFLRQHVHSTVDEAQNILQYSTGKPVPGRQKYHMCTMITNQRASVLPKATLSAAASAQPTSFVDLLCTMPTRIDGQFAKALVDTAANHSMITRCFLEKHNIQYIRQHSVSVGISSAEAPCLGKVTLTTRVGRQQLSVRFTVVDSLPSAAADTYAPNDALFALDVISAADMQITFKHPRIVISVPPPPLARKKRARTWFHVIHLVHTKHTTESSEFDDFIMSQRELKSMTNKARQGRTPLYVVHIKPTTMSLNTCCAGTRKKGYLSTQQAPAHVPQDTSSIPASIQHVIKKHQKQGGTLGSPPPNTHASGFEMNIDLLPGTRPRAARQYRLTPREQLELEKQIKHLIDMGWVQPSISPWASSILFAPKPGGKLRLCIDYRYLNEHTIKNTYPLPRIDSLLDQLRGHKYFSALDLMSGYHQICLSESARPKTAFRTPDGLYQWTVMPFGLSNAPSVFQQAMHAVLSGLIGKICLAYLDDIIVLARSEEEHAQNLDLVLTRLAEHNFFCNTDKCQFALQQIKYLGHIVTADTVRPDPYKVEVLQNWPSVDLQKSANNIRSFLGLAGYFRRFIPKFPTLAGPLLNRISSKDIQPWTKQCEKSFSDIKQALINATAMRHPELNAPFHVYTDASDYAYGAVLTQQHEDKLCPVAWVGRKMNKAEVNYYTLEKELGAIVFAYRQWRCYLENNHPVFIHSDHNPLKFLQTQKKVTGKHARWLESLSRIDWRITYIPGDKNVVADAVSRATHHPDTEVILHDGHTLAAESPHEAYRALALTNLLVRRSVPNSPEQWPELPRSSAASAGPVTFASPTASPSGWQSTPIGMNSSSAVRQLQQEQALQAALQTLADQPSSNVSEQLCHMLRQLQAAPAVTQQAAVSTRLSSQDTRQAPNRHLVAPPQLSPPSGSHSAPQQTLGTSAVTPTRELGKSAPPSEATDSDMQLDSDTFEDIGMHLKHQSERALTLDSAIDDFWDRVRIGYAHDPAFASPPTDYRFDKHLQVYFKEHKLVVPDHDSLRKQVLLWHHVHPWHAHMGIKRTQALITDTFHWPGINNDIKTFVSQCHSCQLMKSPGQSDSTLSPLPVPSACWRVVSLDMITQLPRTVSGFDCIVAFVDQFSKMTRLIPAHSTLDGPGFAKLFFQHIYPHYGLPLGICSDRGVQWNNKFFRSICEHMGIDLRLTFSYHPRANGQVERLNRVIEEALRHFVSPAHDDWDTFLPHVEFSINNSKSQSTGCTPFQLNRLTPPLSPTALAMKLPQPRHLHASVLHRMYYHLAKQSLAEAKQSMWSVSKMPEQSQHFQVGKNVLLSLAKLASHHPSLRRKFTARWIGPCRVLELIGSRAARLQLPTTLKALNVHDVFHFSMLKPFVDARFNEYTAELPTQHSTDAQKVFEVEAVIDYKRSHRSASQSAESGPMSGPHYLIRWKGYSAEHDLWLPVCELSNCLDKVANYLFQNASAKQRNVMIDQFPRTARDKLAHMLQRAQHTTLRARHSTPTAMSQPPRVITRAGRRSRKLTVCNPSPVSAAVARQFECSVCGSTVH